MNFQLGILQSRVQHYRHLKNLLKPLPLETPTRIELAPGKEIQVTLFDANHCTGSVMFLIEGGGKAILYTGDIRCEPYFVNNIRRNPLLIEYTSGLKKLDCIYLDTTFTEPIHFPTKAEGLTELLKKVSKYPADTVFHFKAWTFGYEEVWIALSKSLKSAVHVDQYKIGLYESLCQQPKRDAGPESSPVYLAPEAPALIGHKYGNNYQKGCLTLDPNVRLHSCEKGMRCPALNKNTVFITPILARGTNGVELLELGAGGGAGDLEQKPELEIENDVFVQKIVEMFKNANDDMVKDMKEALLKQLHCGRQTVALDEVDLGDTDKMSLEDIVKTMLEAVPRQSQADPQTLPAVEPLRVADDELPKTITFCYSRHASYEELCDLVAALKPADVYPCTVDEKRWFNGVTMKTLFGECCDEGTKFSYDDVILLYCEKRGELLTQTQTQHVDADLIMDLEEEPVSKQAVDKGKRKASNRPTGDHVKKRPRLLSSDEETSSSNNSARSASIELENSAKPKEDDDMDLVDTDNGGVSDEIESSSSPSQQNDSIWDARDGLWRCRGCSWEKWFRFRACDCQTDDSDVDSVSSDTSVGRMMSNQEFKRLRKVDGGPDCDLELLDGSSTYDSVSDAEDDEYEVDSFIDDEEIEEEQESESDETDAKSGPDENAAYKKLFYEEAYVKAIEKRARHSRMLMATIDCLRDYREDQREDYYSPTRFEESRHLRAESYACDNKIPAFDSAADYEVLFKDLQAEIEELKRLDNEQEAEFEDLRHDTVGEDYISEDPSNDAFDPNFDYQKETPRAAEGKKNFEKSARFKRTLITALRNKENWLRKLDEEKKYFHGFRRHALGPDYNSAEDEWTDKNAYSPDESDDLEIEQVEALNTLNSDIDFEAMHKQAETRRDKARKLYEKEVANFEQYREDHYGDDFDWANANYVSTNASARHRASIQGEDKDFFESDVEYEALLAHVRCNFNADTSADPDPYAIRRERFRTIASSLDVSPQAPPSEVDEHWDESDMWDLSEMSEDEGMDQINDRRSLRDERKFAGFRERHAEQKRCYMRHKANDEGFKDIWISIREAATNIGGQIEIVKTAFAEHREAVLGTSSGTYVDSEPIVYTARARGCGPEPWGDGDKENDLAWNQGYRYTRDEGGYWAFRTMTHDEHRDWIELCKVLQKRMMEFRIWGNKHLAATVPSGEVDSSQSPATQKTIGEPEHPKRLAVSPSIDGPPASQSASTLLIKRKPGLPASQQADKADASIMDRLCSEVGPPANCWDYYGGIRPASEIPLEWRYVEKSFRRWSYAAYDEKEPFLRDFARANKAIMDKAEQLLEEVAKEQEMRKHLEKATSAEAEDDSMNVPGPTKQPPIDVKDNNTQPQISEDSPQDEADRFMKDVEDGVWHETGLLSTGNNHLKEEVEL